MNQKSIQHVAGYKAILLDKQKPALYLDEHGLLLIMKFHENIDAITCLEGYKSTRLLTAEEAMRCLLDLRYAGRSLQRKTFEKRERNAEIYQRYLAGEDSTVLARVYGLSDRRMRNIIEHERKRRGQ